MRKNIVVKIADQKDREEIYKARYLIYAEELHQHGENEMRMLKDELDESNTYVVVRIDGNLAGFVSITSPGKAYGLDRYIGREKYPYIYDNMFEGRLFTVLKKYRGSPVSILLGFSIFRFAEEQNGESLMTYGRIDLVNFYEKMGFADLGETIKSGEVEFRLMFGKIKTMRENCGKLESILKRVMPHVDNQLPFSLVKEPVIKETNCYHGGKFFSAIGEDFKTLDKSKYIINADVLDAWFDPSPKVMESLTEYLTWILKTSPPTHSEGLIKTIAEKRGIEQINIIAGAGSSDLIYLALPQLLRKKSKVLLLNPTYGEYSYILRNVINCEVELFSLKKEDNYFPDADKLVEKLKSEHFELVILVNPNSPTGQALTKEDMLLILDGTPKSTLIWVDETYVEYTGENNSLEQVACKSNNVIICKSMSKVYALSGARCAYLVSNQSMIDKLKLFAPPWAVSLPAQIAGVAALNDPEYYAGCYNDTRTNKELLINELNELNELNTLNTLNELNALKKNNGIKILKGVTNSILIELPAEIDIDTVLKECESKNLFLRNVSNMGVNLGNSLLRIAVKDEKTNKKIAEILTTVLTLQ
jgi:histidinol-phosphate/aromatic aminotransferase/cobyric acid decarboxylase-like protein